MVAPGRLLDKTDAVAGKNGGQKIGGHFIEYVAGAQNAGQKLDKKDVPMH